MDTAQTNKQGLPNYEGKLMLALGFVFLIMIIIVSAMGSWLILRNYKAERIRLGSTVTHVVSHSINKVSLAPQQNSWVKRALFLPEDITSKTFA